MRMRGRRGGTEGRQKLRNIHSPLTSGLQLPTSGVSLPLLHQGGVPNLLGPLTGTSSCSFVLSFLLLGVQMSSSRPWQSTYFINSLGLRACWTRILHNYACTQVRSHDCNISTSAGLGDLHSILTDVSTSNGGLFLNPCCSWSSFSPITFGRECSSLSS